MGLDQREESIEVFIDLGRACNLSCAHCLNKSGPKYVVENLTTSELSELINSINSNSSITHVHFSGGEPTLYKDSICTIQKSIDRDLKYAITSNGSLGRNLKNWLLGLKIDRIHLSADRWHQKQVTIETLKDFISVAKESSIEIEIEVVIESISDLADYQWRNSQNVEIQPRFLVASGRSNVNSRDLVLSSNDHCPTLQGNRGLKKIIWNRNKGYTYCCGPLAFDNQQEKSFIYSDTVDTIEDSPLSQFHNSKTIEQHLKHLGFSSISFAGPCDACSFLHKKRSDLGNVSFFEVLTSKTRYFPITGPVKEQSWRDLGADFKLTYFVYNDSPEKIDVSVFKARPLDELQITRKPVRSFGIEGLVDFLKINFFDRWQNFRTQSDFDKAARGTPAYYTKDLQGFWYLKNEKIVALLVFSKEANHPAVNRDVIHIGHWGYQPELLTKEEIASIKENWLVELTSFSKHHGWLPIDGVIDDFNSASLGLAQKLGFKVHSFRLDKRGLD